MRNNLLICLLFVFTCLPVVNYGQGNENLKEELKSRKRDNYFLNECTKYFKLSLKERCNYFLAKNDSLYPLIWLAFYNDILTNSNQTSLKNFYDIKGSDNTVIITDSSAFLLQIIKYYKSIYSDKIFSDSGNTDSILTTIRVDEPMYVISSYVTLRPNQRVKFIEKCVEKNLNTDFIQLMKLDLDKIYNVDTKSFIKDSKISTEQFNESKNQWKRGIPGAR